MGVIPAHVLDDWERQQNSDYKQRERHTVVQLPCCRSAVEVDYNVDTYVTCPNRLCPELKNGVPKRHLITWGSRTKIHTEAPKLEL